MIGLGSNLGDRSAILDGAVAALSGERRASTSAPSARYHETDAGRRAGGAGGVPQRRGRAGDDARPARACSTSCRRSRRGSGGCGPSGGASGRSTSTCLLFGDEVHRHPELAVPHPRLAVPPVRPGSGLPRSPPTARSIPCTRPDRGRVAGQPRPPPGVSIALIRPVSDPLLLGGGVVPSWLTPDAFRTA